MITPAQLDTLRACPFCGGSPVYAEGHHNFVDVVIVCDGCSAEGPLFDEAPDVEGNRKLAADHWNTRTSDKGSAP